MTNRELSGVVRKYLRHFPDEVARLERLRTLLEITDDVFSRKNYLGHITASAIVLSPVYMPNRILVVHHRATNKWLAPGGHAETTDQDMFYTAQRELKEETGIEGFYLALLKNSPAVPLDIDSHFIPANPAKDEAEHWHHDFRYAFVADQLSIAPEAASLIEAKWVAFDAPETELLRPVINKASMLAS